MLRARLRPYQVLRPRHGHEYGIIVSGDRATMSVLEWVEHLIGHAYASPDTIAALVAPDARLTPQALVCVAEALTDTLGTCVRVSDERVGAPYVCISMPVPVYPGDRRDEAWACVRGHLRAIARCLDSRNPEYVFARAAQSMLG